MKPIPIVTQICLCAGLLWPATAFTQTPTDKAGDPAAAIRHKLETIVVPSLELRGATLSDAVEQLREQASRLDPDPDQSTRGINIFVKLPAPASASGATPHVTLNITHVPMMEALGKVAAQVGMKVKVEPFAVSLVPLSERSEPMTTANFRLPPEALGFASAPPAAGSVPSRDAKNFLESKGVTFPPGASATYLPATQKLVVRNTSGNVEAVKTLFAPVAAPTPKSP